jgi:hypothetical protein
MDTISCKHERLALVKEYAKHRNSVIFEGLITGKTYGAMGELSEAKEHYGRWLYTFMDTPFEECVRRVLIRRQESFMAKHGEDAIDNREFDPERTMRSTFKSVQSVALKAKTYGHDTYHVKHDKRPHDEVKRLIKRIIEKTGA